MITNFGARRARTIWVEMLERWRGKHLRGASIHVAGVISVVMLLAVAWPISWAGATTQNWSQYLFNGSHGSYNEAANSITASNIADLAPVWQWVDPTATHGGSDSLRASPISVGGVVYIGDEDGRFFAIQESTQTVLWSQFIGIVKGTTCGTGGVISTAAVASDPSTGSEAVYVDGPDGYLYAFDAITGSLLWRSLVDVPSTTQNNYYAWGSPLVYQGVVYIGISSMCDKPLVPAGLLAFAQATGKQLAEWHSLPNTMRGASIWSSPGVTADGSIVVTTGNAQKTPQPRWGESIVKLNSTSLAVQGAWKVPITQQISDADFGGSPTMFSATVGGKITPMVGACNKNGNYYAFGQTDITEGPVWQTQVAAPYTTSGGQCDAAAIWDGSRLIAASGNTVSVNGMIYNGAVEALNPTSGTIEWQTGLPGGVIGSPTEDGATVVAAPVFWSSTRAYGVYLLRASDGASLGKIAVPTPMFAQPVFANNTLLVADGHDLVAYEVAAPGPALTGVTPTDIATGTTATLQISGSHFSGVPQVFVSGGDVTVSNVRVVTSDDIAVTLRVSNLAASGKRTVTVTSAGPTASNCSTCLKIVRGTHSMVLSSANPSPFDAPVTFTSTVTPTDGKGTVSFTSDGHTIPGCGSQPLSVNGASATASCTTSTMAIGTSKVVASYSGDTSFGQSNAGLKGGQSVYLPAPSNVRAAVVSSRSVKLTWNAVEGASRYIVFEGESSTGPFTKEKAITVPNWQASGLIAGTPYYFKVRAGTTAAVSEYSITVSATP